MLCRLQTQGYNNQGFKGTSQFSWKIYIGAKKSSVLLLYFEISVYGEFPKL